MNSLLDFIDFDLLRDLLIHKKIKINSQELNEVVINKLLSGEDIDIKREQVLNYRNIIKDRVEKFLHNFHYLNFNYNTIGLKYELDKSFDVFIEPELRELTYKITNVKEEYIPKINDCSIDFISVVKGQNYYYLKGLGFYLYPLANYNTLNLMVKLNWRGTELYELLADYDISVKDYISYVNKEILFPLNQLVEVGNIPLDILYRYLDSVKNPNYNRFLSLICSNNKSKINLKEKEVISNIINKYKK